MQKDTHEAVVEYHHDDDVEGFTAICPCGWQGTLRSAAEYAEDDAQEHMDATAYGPAPVPGFIDMEPAPIQVDATDAVVAVVACEACGIVGRTYGPTYILAAHGVRDAHRAAHMDKATASELGLRYGEVWTGFRVVTTAWYAEKEQDR